MKKQLNKSPFLIQQEFISPLLCDDIMQNVAESLSYPNVDEHNVPQQMECLLKEQAQNVIIEQCEKKIIKNIETYYNTKINNITKPKVMWYPEGYTNNNIICDNANYVDKHWIKTKNRDFSITVFLSDYSNTVPFDGDYEVYGGKIDYPQYNFGFTAERGAAVIHPSCPHFLHAVNPIKCGDLFVIKIYLTTFDPFIYNPSDFSGNYKSWFNL